jgi:uncharacterized membrane protein YoaK (UPF0700 family)
VDTKSANANLDVLLVPPLLALTVVTGLVDAVSYLGLGHVFTANMTGNVVFLAFALGRGLSATRSVTALFVFAFGSFLGGWVANRRPANPADLLLVAMRVEFVLLLLAAGATAFVSGELAPASAYTLIACTALAMGFRNAIVRKVAVPDLPTTVLTSTVTDLAAGWFLIAGHGVRTGRRFLSILAMFGGALAGALLLSGFGMRAPFLASALIVALASFRLSSTSRS